MQSHTNAPSSLRPRRAAVPSDFAANQFAPVPETRLAQEWHENFDRFFMLWKDRTDDFIRRGHPMQFWVWKQRAAYRKKKLQAWQIQRLDSIGFPMDGARLANNPTNAEYAQQLVEFYREHGHHAPTQTIGGAGLAKFTKKFAASKGLRGITTVPPGVDLEADLARARQIVQEGIPDFSYEKCSKKERNDALGLSHNGYAPAQPKEKAPSERYLHVCERVNRDLGVRQMQELLVGPLKPLAAWLPRTSQGLRLRLWSPGLQDRDIHQRFHIANPEGIQWEGWLAAMPQSGSVWTAVGSDELPTDVCLPPQGRLHLGRNYTSAYVTMRREDGSMVTVDADLAWQDQRVLYWHACMNGHLPSLRVDEPMLMSDVTTRNKAFALGYEELKEFLRLEQATLPPGQVPHLTWKSHKRHYEFVRHRVKLHASGQHPPTHSRLLASLKFELGAQRESASWLFQDLP